MSFVGVREFRVLGFRVSEFRILCRVSGIGLGFNIQDTTN